MLILLIFSILSDCENPSDSGETIRRGDTIPKDAVKMTSEVDNFPPVLHCDEWSPPIPVDGLINTAGAEDAPVITPDGNTLFFFFTPDVDVPPEKQILDAVSGVWWSKKNNNTWTEPERIILHHGLSLDAPLCILGDTLWFASFRNGNYGDDGDVYLATFLQNKWYNWQNAGSLLNKQYNVGELYLRADGKLMVFHRGGAEGLGGTDLWQSEKKGSAWTEPINLGVSINSELDEGMPFLSSDGKELWFNRPSGKGYTGPALFRSIKTDSGWSQAEEIISNFAGDPALDDKKNIYFTHHFFNKEMKMIEADIYVAYKK